LVTLMKNKPRYVSFLGQGQISFQTPLLLSGVTTWAFGVRTSPRVVQKFLDSTLNQVSNGAVTFKAVGRTAILQFMDVSKATSTAETVGYLPDRECAIWIPVLQREGPGIPRLRFFVSYLILDQIEGVVTGREVWGYPKTFGSIDLPRNEETTDRWIASTTIFPVHASSTRGLHAPLITVHGLQGRWLRSGSPWTSLGEAIEGIRSLAPGSADVEVYDPDPDGPKSVGISDFLRPALTFINLKQFRDAEDSSRACYQALVEAPNEIKSVSHGGAIDVNGLVADFTTCQSHQIVSQHGLATTVGLPFTRVPILWGFWVKQDFGAEVGRIVWEASG
jgi:hypothetical protein